MIYSFANGSWEESEGEGRTSGGIVVGKPSPKLMVDELAIFLVLSVSFV